MRRSLPFLVFLSVVILADAVPPQSPQNNPTGTACGTHGRFTTTCNPYGRTSKPHAIDNTCGLTGDATSSGDQAQDRQKNNLCATGTPSAVTIATLKSLQEAVDTSGVDYGSTHSGHHGPPANRASLFTKVSANAPKEGDLVSFVGFIAEAKPGSSETVNCHCGPDPLAIDVHMALADHPLNLQKAPRNATPQAKHQITVSNDAQLCTNSFVAETIPHLRPASLELTAIQPLVGNNIVKVTGQLLFDGSHRPCQGNTPGTGDPSRVVVFEIHPVYKIEVCTQNSLDQCKADSANWQPLAGAVPPSGGTPKGGKTKKGNPN